VLLGENKSNEEAALRLFIFMGHWPSWLDSTHGLLFWFVWIFWWA